MNHTVNKVTCSLKWALDECCWSYFSQVLHNTKDLTIFNNSFSAQRDYECQILLSKYYLLSGTKTTTLNNIQVLLKACVCYFLSNFYFSPMLALVSSKKLLSFSRYSNFCISVFPSFFLPVSHCFRGWSDINFKAYDVINCLNKNLITHFFDFLGWKLWHWNHAENVHQKLVPDPFLIVVKKTKMCIRNSFKHKIFWK